MKRYFFVLIGLLFFALNFSHVSAQKQNAFGFEYAVYTSTADESVTRYGLSYEYQFDKHWGLETGLMSKRMHLLEPNLDLKFVQVPLMAKFYSKPLNITFGVRTNFYTGAKSADEVTSVTSVTGVPKLNFELAARLSHDFRLGESWLIEPSLEVMPYATDFERFYVGPGLKLKYNFN